MSIKEFNRDTRINNFFYKQWGSEFIVSGNEKLFGNELPGFMFEEHDEIIGLLTYHISGNDCEVVSLDSLKPNLGIGTKLINAIINKAKELGITKLWLMTTNDNLDALKFYQKRGFVLCGINTDAIKKSRDLGQNIPETGYYNIPIRDEIILEYLIK